MKKIDKTQVLTVILGVAMLFLSLESIALVCEGFSYVIIGTASTYNALSIVTGFLLVAPITFFGFRLLDKSCNKLKLIASLTNLFILLLIFIFSIVVVADKKIAIYAPRLMIDFVLVLISWIILDFDSFRNNLPSFKIVKVENSKIEESSNLEVEEETKEDSETEENK